jgi:phage-related protein
METFPLPYLFLVDKDITFATRSVVFESQKKQIQQVGVNPMTKWKISCRGNNDDRLVLESFQYRMGGNTRTFYFTDENLVQRTVRFADQGISLKLTRDFTTANVTHGTVVGFTADITVEVAL